MPLHGYVENVLMVFVEIFPLTFHPAAELISILILVLKHTKYFHKNTHYYVMTSGINYPEELKHMDILVQNKPNFDHCTQIKTAI